MSRILIVDDERMMAKTLVDILRAKGYRAEAAYSGLEALHRLSEALSDTAPFDCVLSDIKMPGLNGVELYRAIRETQPDLPVVLMTAYSTDGLVEAGLDEGVVGVLIKPLDLNLVLCFLSLLAKGRSVVIVDDDPEFARTLGSVLQARGFVVTPVTAPHEAMSQVGADGQVVLLDMKLDHSNGAQVLRDIRARYPSLPVVLVTGYRLEMASAIEAAMAIDAYACLYKPLAIDELLRLLDEIRHRELVEVLNQG